MKRVVLAALAILSLSGLCRAASASGVTAEAAVSPAGGGGFFGVAGRHRMDLAATSNPTPDPYPTSTHHRRRHRRKGAGSPTPSVSPEESPAKAETSPTPSPTPSATPTPAPTATATPAAVESPVAVAAPTPKRSKKWLRAHHIKPAASPEASVSDLGPLPQASAAPQEGKKPETGAPAGNGNAMLGEPNSFIPSATEAATPASLADQDAAERKRFNDVKAKALADDKVMGLKEKMDTAPTADEQASASKVFYKALYSKMRELDPTLKDRIDRMQALTTKRLEGGQ